MKVLKHGLKKRSYFKFNVLITLLAVLLLVISACTQIPPKLPESNNEDYDTKSVNKNLDSQKIDDWQYDPSKLPYDQLAATTKFAYASSSVGVASISQESIGLAVGGANDINNFRENIKNNFLPLTTDITYEGLFYDYYFDTNQLEECEKLFCPSYSYAMTQDPLSKENEYYLSLGLNSGIKETDFKRKKLNLIVVLDISGSMDSTFNKYYYDEPFNGEKSGVENDFTKTKMTIAAESLVGLLEHLNDDDQFGMVLFDDQAYLAKPLHFVAETDMNSIKDHILEIQSQGGTNMESGMLKATELFEELKTVDRDKYENRIIFVTDAMPNMGDTSEHGLLHMIKSNAKNNIYTTFVGVGVDFNTALTESITKVKGANYYSVHSSAEFKQRMDDEFEFMVTPLVFDLLLSLESDGFEIEKVYGSPEADESTGQIMKINTLFPSRKENGETKGGLVLVKLKKVSDENQIKLRMSYVDRNGKPDVSQKMITLTEKSGDFFPNSGIRKGILLTRYATLMKAWIIDEQYSAKMSDKKYFNPIITYETGISIPEEIELGVWERPSTTLTVSPYYHDLIEEFAEYMNTEITAIGDDTLRQELKLLEKLIETGKTI